MRIYIASRFKGAPENKKEIEKLCSAVRAAGMEDFHFIRDIENYESNFFSTGKELWDTARRYIAECDAMLIDVSDSPSGGRLVEAGIAYALDKPIFIVVENGVTYKDFYNGIATSIIPYDNVDDITGQLKGFKNGI